MNDINFENRFWLQILGDHMRFLATTLAPVEKEFLTQVLRFQQEADRLLRIQNADIIELLNLATSVRELKLDILNQHLVGKIKINLPPTFINHMLNELEQYIKILLAYQETGQVLIEHPIAHHSLWLSDADGHADAIITNLDATEKITRKKFKKMKKTFQTFYLKAIEYAGYLRTGTTDFPALDKFDREVNITITLFINMLKELEAARLDNSILGHLQPLMANHMVREEAYYLTKLGFQPNYNPTAARIES